MRNAGVNRNKSCQGCVSRTPAKRKSSRVVHDSRARVLRKEGNSHFKILFMSCHLSLFISCRLQLPEHNVRTSVRKSIAKGHTCIKKNKNKITLPSRKKLVQANGSRLAGSLLCILVSKLHT